jgi:peroxiredoxin
LQAQNKSQKEAAPMKLKVGDMAPDFTLLAFDGKELKKISLADYRGKKNVALAFFVFAFPFPSTHFRRLLRSRYRQDLSQRLASAMNA